MNRFLGAAENGGLLTDCTELSPNHTASPSSSSCCSDAGRYAAQPSLQTRGPVGGGGGGSCGLEQRRSAQKRSRAGREGRGEAGERSAAAVAVRGSGGGSGSGGGDACAFGKRQPQQQQQQRLLEAQGRGDGLEMISAVSRDVDSCGNVRNNNLVPEINASPAGCPKSKEERKGKNVIRSWKRERDRDAAAPPAPPLRTRKEKPGDGSSPPPPSVFLPEHHPCRDGSGLCPCAAPDCGIMGDNSNVNNNNNCGSSGGGAAGKATLDCGVKSGGGAIVVRRQHDDTPAAKKHRGAEKVRGILLSARKTGSMKK